MPRGWIEHPTSRTSVCCSPSWAISAMSARHQVCRLHEYVVEWQSLQRTYPFPRSKIFKKLMKMNSLRNPSESEYTQPLVCSERLCRPYTWWEKCNTQPFSGRISNSNIWIWAYTFLTLSPVEKRLRLCSEYGLISVRFSNWTNRPELFVYSTAKT